MRKCIVYTRSLPRYIIFLISFILKFYETRGPIFFIICCSLFLLDLYSETQNKYCRTNGNADVHSELSAAQASCLANDECLGLFDNCGDGTILKHCNAPMSIVDSGCGSILYRRKGE